MSTQRRSPYLLALGLIALGLSACIPDVVPQGSAPPPRCKGLDQTCGSSHDESCCASQPIEGAPFKRSNGTDVVLASVTGFELDRFEVTVGRFRQFVDAYPDNRPAEGAGAHPLIAASGWQKAWDEHLPASREALVASLQCNPQFQTWTQEPGANDNRPINCVNWYVAFAFCAWDQGRLPTDAERYYAASRGSEKLYPWGDTPLPDTQHASYDCLADGSAAQQCSLVDIPEVGSMPSGDGRWRQADLAGGMMEWALDWFGAYPSTCDDCAQIEPPPNNQGRSAWGGDWSHGADLLLASSRIGYDVDKDQPTETFHGLRCARDD